MPLLCGHLMTWWCFKEQESTPLKLSVNGVEEYHNSYLNYSRKGNNNELLLSPATHFLRHHQHKNLLHTVDFSLLPFPLHHFSLFP